MRRGGSSALIAIAMIGVNFAGCATIVTGTKDTVLISSVPPGAIVEIQGKVISTPADVTLSRSFFGSERARATLTGYQTRRFRIQREFNMWTLGNVVTLFFLTPVDMLSGAIVNYPDEYEFRLYPIEHDEVAPR